MNEDIDIPLLSERREARIIEKFVDRIVPKVEPSLQAIMPDIYVRCVCQKHWFPRHILAVLILGVGNPHAVERRAAEELFNMDVKVEPHFVVVSSFFYIRSTTVDR